MPHGSSAAGSALRPGSSLPARSRPTPHGRSAAVLSFPHSASGPAAASPAAGVSGPGTPSSYPPAATPIWGYQEAYAAPAYSVPGDSSSTSAHTLHARPNPVAHSSYVHDCHLPAGERLLPDDSSYNA